MSAREPIIIAESNGHRWIWLSQVLCDGTNRDWIACRDCAVIRRRDDQNKPCRGAVGVELRQADENQQEDETW